jgi:uncharacterized membrane protein YbaN (DUF454 family)
MKTLKIIMLIIGILSFGLGAFNIIVSGLPNQWFGFFSGGFLIWMYFNLDRIYQKDIEKVKRER